MAKPRRNNERLTQKPAPVDQDQGQDRANKDPSAPEDSPLEIAMRLTARREEFKKQTEERANSRISLEFGDSTVVVRDGLDRMVERIPLNRGWSERVGEIMVARNCTEVGARISEHARFTIREVKVLADKSRASKGGIPSMQFEEQ